MLEVDDKLFCEVLFYLDENIFVYDGFFYIFGGGGGD